MIIKHNNKIENQILIFYIIDKKQVSQKKDNTKTILEYIIQILLNH